MSSLTPEQASQLKLTFVALLGDTDGFARTLYAKLFDQYPALRSMFANDMTQQREKLIATLAQVVRACDNLEALEPQLRELGQRHAEFGTLPAHYDALRAVFIDTLRETLGERFDVSAEAAWASLYDDVSKAMLGGMRQE